MILISPCQLSCSRLLHRLSVYSFSNFVVSRCMKIHSRCPEHSPNFWKDSRRRKDDLQKKAASLNSFSELFPPAKDGYRQKYINYVEWVADHSGKPTISLETASSVASSP